MTVSHKVLLSSDIGWMYGNALFKASCLSLHPQSSPAIALTTLSTPVAFVTLATVSPKPRLFLVAFFFVGFAFFFEVSPDFPFGAADSFVDCVFVDSCCIA